MHTNHASMLAAEYDIARVFASPQKYSIACITGQQDGYHRNISENFDNSIFWDVRMQC